MWVSSFEDSVKQYYNFALNLEFTALFIMEMIVIRNPIIVVSIAIVDFLLQLFVGILFFPVVLLLFLSMIVIAFVSMERKAVFAFR